MGRRAKGEALRVDMEEGDSGPDAIDVHVGSRIRLRRTLRGMSQTTLGEAVGLTFQQIQKYERGANRVSASRLWQFAQVLDVPVSFFFDDMPSELLAERGPVGAMPTTAPSTESGVMARRETLELVRAYYGIQDPNVRKRLYDTFKAVAGGVGSAGEAEDA